LDVGVEPGAVDTPITSGIMDDQPLLERLIGAIPPGRLARPEKIVALVVFLAGDGARVVTATIIVARR
jgi:NAD(P)-dependent dehydrogenase (short-subunit alcohol dehydrogenase family)